MRRQPAERLTDQIDTVMRLLGQARKVMPVLVAQAALEHNELTGRLPTTAVQCDRRDPDHPGQPVDCDGSPHDGLGRHPARIVGDSDLDYADPTGEAVVNHRHRADGRCDPSHDLERLALFHRDLAELIGSARRILNQVPASTVAVNEGRAPTDGRSQTEYEQRRYVREISDQPCVVAWDHAETDLFGPGMLRGGMCNRHRMQFTRWCAERVELRGLDRPAVVIRWRAAVWPDSITPADAEEPEAERGRGPWKAVK